MKLRALNELIKWRCICVNILRLISILEDLLESRINIHINKPIDLTNRELSHCIWKSLFDGKLSFHLYLRKSINLFNQFFIFIDFTVFNKLSYCLYKMWFLQLNCYFRALLHFKWRMNINVSVSWWLVTSYCA